MKTICGLIAAMLIAQAPAPSAEYVDGFFYYSHDYTRVTFMSNTGFFCSGEPWEFGMPDENELYRLEICPKCKDVKYVKEVA